MSCPIITKEVRDLAKKFPYEGEESVLNLVGLWQEKKGKTSEDYPEGWELANFIKELRDPKAVAKRVEVFTGNWSRQDAANQTNKVFLFGDNTDDRVNTHHVPTMTQAVIRGLPNAIGIDTKKNRGTSEDSYFTDADFDVFKATEEDISLAKKQNCDNNEKNQRKQVKKTGDIAPVRLKRDANNQAECPRCGAKMKYLEPETAKIVNGRADFSDTVARFRCDECDSLYRQIASTDYYQ